MFKPSIRYHKKQNNLWLYECDIVRGKLLRVIHYMLPCNVSHLKMQLSFILRNDEAHENLLIVLVIPCFQAPSAVSTKVLVPGGLIQWIYIRGLFQAIRCGKRGGVQRDHVTALYLGQSCGKICRDMEPECPTGIQRSTLGLLWEQCSLEVLCLNFSVSESISRCPGEQNMKHSQLVRSCWAVMLSVVLSGRGHWAALEDRNPH